MEQYVCSECGFTRPEVRSVAEHVATHHSTPRATIRAVDKPDEPGLLARVWAAIPGFRA